MPRLTMRINNICEGICTEHCPPILPDVPAMCTGPSVHPRHYGSSFLEREDKILHLDSLVVCLNRRRNSLLGAHRLPPELLVKIFAELVPVYRSDIEPLIYTQNSASSIPKWISFSQVSHYWRRVALDSTVLWRCPDWSRGARLATEMIQRSQLQPLDVQTKYLDFSLAHHALTTARTCASRMRTLDIAIFGKDICSLLPDMDLGDFPRLETLQLRSGMPQSLFENRNPAVDAVLHIQSAPKLRHIHLEGCSLSITPHIFPSLICLHLEDVPKNSMMSAVDLVRLLPSGTPNLERLVLRHALRDETLPMHASWEPPTSLFRLAELDITGPWSASTYILDRTRSRINPRITIRIISGWLGTSFQRFSAALASYLFESNNAVLPLAMEWHECHRTLTAVGWHPNHPHAGRLEISLPFARQDTWHLMSVFGSDMQTLSLFVREAFLEHDWLAAFGAARHLVDLTISEMALDACMHSLSIFDVNCIGGVFLPALKTLTVSDIDMIVCADTLIGGLRARQNLGAPLKRLNLENRVQIHQPTLMTLNNLVPTYVHGHPGMSYGNDRVIVV